VLVYHAFSFSLFKYLIPFFLISVPYVFQARINLRFRIRDILIGFIVSAAILLPFWYLMLLNGRSLLPLSTAAVFFQLLGVSLPEEIYFRGFLQERLGNNIRGILIVSLLFSVMHLPQYIFYGDFYSVMTFFPSLIMGFLYMKTSNIIPSVIFHFNANIVFLGLNGILSRISFQV